VPARVVGLLPAALALAVMAVGAQAVPAGAGALARRAAAAVVAAPGDVRVQANVVRCATGDPFPIKRPPEPTTLPVLEPAGYQGKLEVYVDGIGFRLLAPGGWQCSAEYGQDGSGGFTVAPPGCGRLGPRCESVVTWSMGFCTPCSLNLACPYFKTTALWRQYNEGTGCAPLPPKDVVVALSPHLVAYYEPPGLDASSTLPDNGVAQFYPEINLFKSNLLSETRLTDCVLPSRDHALCTSVLNEYITWEGGPHGPPS